LLAETSEAVYRFVVAPRFALERGFEQRLERNGGVRHEGEHFHPRNDWRPLEAAELSSLLGELPARDAVLSPAQLGLIQIPDRLRAAWWDEAERSGVTTGGGSFELIFSKIADFLRFKRLPMPERVSLSVAVSAPGLSSTRVDAGGTLQGLAFGESSTVSASIGGPTIAFINLGDETTHLVVLEFPPAVLVRRLEEASVQEAGSFEPKVLVQRYFGSFPDQPLLRVRLEPGEGLWLSPFGVVHDGWTAGKADLDVILHVGAEAPSRSRAAATTASGVFVPGQS
jgi:hypothetical protein